jgi:uncharacterized tellurite resistance protein B-like protein
MANESSTTAETGGSGLADSIRSTLHQLEEYEADDEGSLQTVAFLLQRVAGADGSVSAEEIERMETVLADHRSLTRPQAVVAVEIARHCARIADCGGAYGASRRLRAELDEDQRRRVYGMLTAVAEADGLVDGRERAALHQIAVELGLP